MSGLGDIARPLYVKGSRAARSVARRTGLYDRLDRRYREAPRSAAGHLRTLFGIYDVEELVALDQPWWTYDAIDAVTRHLEALGGAARVFEYGSGASSVWLGRRAGEVHSIEHDSWFAGVMRRLLAERGLDGTVALREITIPASSAPVVRSGRSGEEGKDFADYVAAIDDVPGEFDLVVVDGRARVACMEAASRRLAPGGVILFDDTQRSRYRAGIAASGLDVVAYRGWVPSLPLPRETSLLRIGPR